MFEDDHRVRVGERGRQHPARILGRRRGDHLESRNVREPTLQAVGVLGGQLPTGSRGRAHHEGDGELATRHVQQRRGGVHQLVERQQAEVDRHDLDDRAQPHHRGANAHAGESELGDRRVDHAHLADLVARLHQVKGDQHGLDFNNYIGLLPQSNTWLA